MDFSAQNFLKSVEVNPNSISTLEQLSKLYFNDSRYEEALNIYNRLAELDPNNPQYYNDIGVILYALNMTEQAEWMLRKSMEVGCGWQEAHLNLARLLTEKGDEFDAIKHYFKYLQEQSWENTIREEFELFLEKCDLNRILIVMEEGIGNMIMLTHAIRSIKSAHPQMKIHVLGKYPALEIVEKWDLVESVLTKPDGTRYAAVYYSMWSSGAKKYYGEILDKCSAYHLTIDYTDPNMHEAVCHLKIANSLGFSQKMPPSFCPTEEVDIDIPKDKKLIGICDTSLPLEDWKRKRWPHYRDLAKALASKGYHIVLFGGKTEANEYDSHAWPKETTNFMGKYSLPQTAYLMTQCQAVIANDSGPAHMAAALGIPTFVIFGPTWISKNKPMGENVTVITKNLSCSPCQYSSRWQQCNDWRCMSDIKVHDVIEALETSENCYVRLKNDTYVDSKKDKILIVGVLDVSSSTNVFMKKGFEKLNFHVDAYNYRTRARDLESYEAMWEDFKQFLSDERYELILFSKVNGMDPELINYAKQFGKTWYWFMDNIDVARAVHAEEFVKRADFASATSEEVVAWFEKYNPKTSQIVEGFDPEVYYDEKLEKIHDVLFFGNATPKRIQELKEIKNGFFISVFGNDWPEAFNAKPAIYNKELRRTIAQSRIILNLVHSNIFSDRIILTAASGGFVLSQYCQDLERHFDRKRHLDWFENITEARGLIQYYLINETDREKIAVQGKEYVRNKFGWDKICNKVFEIVGGENTLHSVGQVGDQTVGETEKHTCSFCSGKLIGPIAMDLLQCENCRVYRKKDVPQRDDLKEQLKSFLLGACVYKEKEVSRLEKAEYQLDLLEKYIRPGRVYDVGAAAGFFMKAAKERGWDVKGNEISRAAVDWARNHYGLEIEYGFLEELNPLRNTYDAVVLWNTLEHTIDAKETLEICRSMLRNEGLLMIQVPDKKDEEDLIRRYESLHIYEFDRNNLPRLLEQMGFEQLEMIPQDGNDKQHMTLVYRKRMPDDTEVVSKHLEKTIERVMFVSWHGLGDNVMLTSALRKYKQKFPNKYIAVAGLKRFGETLKQLLSGLWFVDEVIPCLPDAWNDFDNYDTGVQAVVTEAKRIAKDKGYNDVVVLPTHRQSGYKMHKIFRFADEVGIQFECLEDLQTELAVAEDAEQRVTTFISDYRKPILVLHTIAGNTNKTLVPEIVEKIIEQFPQHTILEFGRQSTQRSILVPEDDMEFSKALIKNADQIVAIDSVVMHIAGAFRKPCVAVFTTTPVHQAIPVPSNNITTIGVDNEITQLSKWPEFENQIKELFSISKKKTSRVLITGAGHSGGNWATEIVNLSGQFNFTEHVEDRALFLKDQLPNGYGTKLATDNVGMYPENIKKLLDKYKDLKVIFTLRHPVDNCLSKIYRGTRSDENEPVPDTLNYSWDSTIAGSVKSIEHMYTVMSFLQDHYRDRVLFVKLEDLIADANDQVNRVCKFLGIEKNGKMVEAYKFSRNRHHNTRYKGTLDKSQIGIHNRWDEIYKGFFKNKKYIVDKLFVDLKSFIDALGYAEKRCSINDVLSFNKMALPDHYYLPITYWAHMITFRCNGNCPFCILNGRGRHQIVKELSGKEILEFWNNLKHPAGQRLSLIGGEPTLHRDIVEIVNNLEGYDITLTTNCKGPFYSDPNFYKKFKTKPSSTLRINTTFHPHFISAEDYIQIIKKYRQTGYFVDQTSYVYRPDVVKYQKEIDKVSREIPIKAAPYLGFYDSQNQFEAPFLPNYIEPNENYHDLEAASRICGLTSIDSYRDMCGQYEKRQVTCQHPMVSLIIGPEGDYYHCHYKLYYGIDPVCNIKKFVSVRKENFDCRHYGFCNWCDVPRVGCKKNPTAQKMVLNKLYDQREFKRSEIQFLINDISNFSNKHQLEFNPLKWFEYSYCILYSGHRHRGKVLDVGSAKSVFPYYLSSKGYDVTTIDIADSNYRNEKSNIFNVKSITGDLRKAYHEFEGKFDLISNLSVIEHIYEDTQVVLNLTKYLKPGGIMVVSTDFYERYIEYPDANREIVKDRPMGSHTDSRVYTPETFLDRIVKPLEAVGVHRLGLTDYKNVDIKDPRERAVRGLYTFGIAVFRKKLS